MCHVAREGQHLFTLKRVEEAIYTHLSDVTIMLCVVCVLSSVDRQINDYYQRVSSTRRKDCSTTSPATERI